MINLCCVDIDIKKITDINSVVIKKNKIEIYFPIFDYFYITTFHSKQGFTVAQLIKNIELAGQTAMTYDAIINHLDPELSRSSLVDMQ
jgi:hypothetical protein